MRPTHPITCMVLTAFSLLGVATAGCQPANRPPLSDDPQIRRTMDAVVGAPGDVWVRTELYFGLRKPDDVMLTREEWGTFVANEVLPRFPDGLTLVEGLGQFRGPVGLPVVEPSRVLIVMHPPGEAADRLIEEIRDIYKQRFGMLSVMRVTSMAKVSF